MRIFSSRFLSVYLPLLLLALGLAAPVQAIIIRHDRADSRYLVDEHHYPQIFFLHRRFGNKVCMATLIKPNWAITAAHCVEQTPIKETLETQKTYPLIVAGQNYEITQLVIHPDYLHSEQSKTVDLALLKLDRAVAKVRPAMLYQEHDEAGKVVSFLGWGYGGIGTLGRQGNDGKLRRAQNTVMHAGQWLQFRFSDPREPESKALPQEGIPGLGDSGGPAVLETENGLIILGVAIGEVADEQNPAARQGRYGAIELYERLSSHLDWINKTIADNL